MLPDRLSAPNRALVFYSTTLVLLSMVGSSIQATLKLNGVILNELLFFLGLALLFITQVERRPLRAVLRLHPVTLKVALRSLLLGLLAWALAEVLAILITLLVHQLGGSLYETHSALRQAPFLMALLAGAVLPAIAEEVAFRGYLQWGLAPLGARSAILITGLLFGAMHFSLIRLLPLAALGILFSAAVQRSGSILPGIIMHFVNNGITLTLAFFYKPSGGSAGLDSLPASAVSVLFLLVAAVGLGWAAWSVAGGFGPRSAGGVDPDGSSETAVPFSAKLLLPLLPALLLYGGIVAQELLIVFGS